MIKARRGLGCLVSNHHRFTRCVGCGLQLIDAEAHRKAIDAFLDVLDTDIVGSAAAVAVSDMLYEILVLTRLHKALSCDIRL